MGKARWWVCDECKSLNDVPANKCYNCRTKKPKEPTLIDDQYSEVGEPQSRVGITVERKMIENLVAPDPQETAEPDAFATMIPGQRSAEAGEDTATQPALGVPPPPISEPPRRGIDQLGGRAWADEPTSATASTGAPTMGVPNTGVPNMPPPPGQVPAPPPSEPPPPPGHVPPPGQVPAPPPSEPPPPPGHVPPPGQDPAPGVVPPPHGQVPPPGAVPQAGYMPPPPGLVPAPPGYVPPPPGSVPPHGYTPPGEHAPDAHEPTSDANEPVPDTQEPMTARGAQVPPLPADAAGAAPSFDAGRFSPSASVGASAAANDPVPETASPGDHSQDDDSANAGE